MICFQTTPILFSYTLDVLKYMLFFIQSKMTLYFLNISIIEDQRVYAPSTVCSKSQVCRQINLNDPLVYLLADEARAFLLNASQTFAKICLCEFYVLYVSRDCTSKMYIADLSSYIFFYFMKKTMKHLTKLTFTSTTSEHIGFKNRPRASGK